MMNDMKNENWIYTENKLPPLNERVLLYLMSSTGIEYSTYGVWNGEFYETHNCSYAKEEIIAWQKIDPPKKLKEIIKDIEFEKYAETWANARVNYELEYANTMNVLDKEQFINWIKDHIYITSKKAFNDCYEYMRRIGYESKN